MRRITIEGWQLKQLQSLPIEIKIEKTKQRIREWYEYWNGQVYISFSGGKDSTVLLHIVKSLYPDVPAVFVDTGLEYPEIREFVKTIDNVIWLKPKMNFKDVIEKYGYPVISKEVSLKVKSARSTPNGYASQSFDRNSPKNIKQNQKYSCAKYKYLLDAPFLVSHQCCDVMKKNPIKKYEKKEVKYAILGTMASESTNRNTQYLKYGCNAFDKARPTSQPLSFWLEEDIWNYIKTFNLSYSKIYDMGYERTGCMFCMFGCHLEKEPNRFQKMKITHPKLYDYCMNKLGLGDVLDYIKVNYK